MERSYERMVVYDIGVLDLLIGVKNMTDLIDAVPRPYANGLFEDGRSLYWTGAISGRAQDDFVPGPL